MNENSRKLKLLYVLEILSKKADADNPVTVEEIISELKKKGLDAERKSVYSDIDALREAGYSIETVKSKSFGYYISSRPISFEGLTALWDAAHACEFISHKRCGEIKKSLESLANDSEKALLRKRVYTINKTLRQPDTFLTSLTAIHKAISEKKQIIFSYTNALFANKSKKEVFNVSPYIVNCSGGVLSLIAGCPELEGLNHFYIDRMENVAVSQQNATDVREFVGDMEFDLMCYSRGLYESYSPNALTVKLQCENEMLNAVIGTFGKQAAISPCPGISDMFYVSFDTEISESLLSWLFVNSETVKVIEPKELIDSLKNAAKDIYIKYS